MGVVLRVLSGSAAGREIEIGEGMSLAVGRSPRSDLRIDGDGHLSGVHFVVGVRNSECRIEDRQSSNGTLVNDRRITDPAILRDGDRILAGTTRFEVRMAQTGVAIGPFLAPAIPPGWEAVEGRGIQRTADDPYRTNIVGTADRVEPDVSLEAYIESQVNLVKRVFPDAQADVLGPAAIPQADEAIALVIRRTLPDGHELLQRQIYARREGHVGVLTFTTVSAEEARMQPRFDELARECRFHPAEDQAGRE